LLLEEKLYTNLPYPSQQELIALAEASNLFDFLHAERTTTNNNMKFILKTTETIVQKNSCQ
jgi:hypothetical protein